MLPLPESAIHWLVCCTPIRLIQSAALFVVLLPRMRISPPPEYMVVTLLVLVPKYTPLLVLELAKPSGTPSLAVPSLAPLSRPPANTILPPPLCALVVKPLLVLTVVLSPKVMAPAVPAAKLLAQKVRSPLLVLNSRPVPVVMLPVALSKISASAKALVSPALALILPA